MEIKFNPAFPVGNAAGWCKSLEEVKRLAATDIQVIMFGSITVPEKEGNLGYVFDDDPTFPQNSIGLRNPGLEWLEQYGVEIVRTAHSAGKKIFLSITGKNVEEFVKLSAAAEDLGFDGIEINLGCPNLVDGSKRKPVFSNNVQLSEKVVHAVMEQVGPLLVVWVKVSPSMDYEHIQAMADMLCVGTAVDGVVTMNTVVNTLRFRPDGKPVIDTPDGTGWAGGSGRQVKAMALGQVSMWHRALGGRIPVIGVGGIACNPHPGERENDYGHDVMDMLRAGASFVQVGTAYFVNGAKFFSEIATQFINLQTETKE